MHMNKFLGALMAAALILTTAACDKTNTGKTDDADKSPVLVTVDNKNITVDDFKAEAATLPPYASQLLADPATREKFIDELVSKALIVEDARKKGMDKDPEVVKRMNQILDNMMLQSYVSKEIFDKADVTDQDVKEYFDKNKANLGSVRLSHIQVGTKDEAEEVLVKYKAGTPFAELAKEYSEDKSTKSTGGDLGWMEWSQIASSDLRDAAFNTPLGDVSNVIKSSFAFHIIKVTDKKPATDAEFDKLKGKIKEFLSNKKREDLFNARVEELKKTAKITKNEEAIKGMGSSGEVETPEAMPMPETEAAPKEAPAAKTGSAPKPAPAPAGK